MATSFPTLLAAIATITAYSHAYDISDPSIGTPDGGADVQAAPNFMKSLAVAATLNSVGAANPLLIAAKKAWLRTDAYGQYLCTRTTEGASPYPAGPDGQSFPNFSNPFRNFTGTPLDCKASWHLMIVDWAVRPDNGALQVSCLWEYNGKLAAMVSANSEVIIVDVAAGQTADTGTRTGIYLHAGPNLLAFAMGATTVRLRTFASGTYSGLTASVIPTATGTMNSPGFFTRWGGGAFQCNPKWRFSGFGTSGAVTDAELDSMIAAAVADLHLKLPRGIHTAIRDSRGEGYHDYPGESLDGRNAQTFRDRLFFNCGCGGATIVSVANGGTSGNTMVDQQLPRALAIIAAVVPKVKALNGGICRVTAGVHGATNDVTNNLADGVIQTDLKYLWAQLYAGGAQAVIGECCGPQAQVGNGSPILDATIEARETKLRTLQTFVLAQKGKLIVDASDAKSKVPIASVTAAAIVAGLTANGWFNAPASLNDLIADVYTISMDGQHGGILLQPVWAAEEQRALRTAFAWADSASGGGSTSNSRSSGMQSNRTREGNTYRTVTAASVTARPTSYVAIAAGQTHVQAVEGIGAGVVYVDCSQTGTARPIGIELAMQADSTVVAGDAAAPVVCGVRIEGNSVVIEELGTAGFTFGDATADVVAGAHSTQTGVNAAIVSASASTLSITDKMRQSGAMDDLAASRAGGSVKPASVDVPIPERYIGAAVFGAKVTSGAPTWVVVKRLFEG